MTTASPTKKGMEPSSNPTATIKPQSPTGSGLRKLARSDVNKAVPTSAPRSSSKGKATTLQTSTIRAKIKPTPKPPPIIVQPADVLKTSCKNADSEAGRPGPSVS